MMRLEAFTPRSESKFVFAAAMASYAWLLTGVVNAIIRTFHRAVRPVSLLPDSLYWFTILIDALLIAAIFEVLRRLRVGIVVQVVVASVLLSATRALSAPLWSFTVAPIYIICALSYVYWRQRSWWASFCVVLLTQAIYDIVPAIRALFPAVPNA
jgi:hypothetical protein